jgi:hypothetical protein
MYGAVLNSEGSRVEIGECAIVCENAVLRATASGDAGTVEDGRESMRVTDEAMGIQQDSLVW